MSLNRFFLPSRNKLYLPDKHLFMLAEKSLSEYMYYICIKAKDKNLL